MNDAHNHQQHSQDQGSFWSSRAFLVFVVFAGMAIVLLWGEHKAHILGAIPYVFILLCPLMHIFMHGGHGHGGHGGTSADSRKNTTDERL